MAKDSRVAGGGVWLEVWESAAGASSAQRIDALLRPLGASSADVGLHSIGTRDALLLDLRGALFGQMLACTAACPACGDRCEWDCTLDELRASPTAYPANAGLEVAEGEWQVRLRAVTVDDLHAVTTCVDESSAVRGLLARCVLEARRDGQQVDVATLPDVLVERISTALEAADPQAALSVTLTCPACAHTWEAAFDIGAYLWTELDAWAQHTLADVHELASRYGWSEAEILALPPARRARYLAMAGA